MLQGAFGFACNTYTMHGTSARTDLGVGSSLLKLLPEGENQFSVTKSKPVPAAGNIYLCLCMKTSVLKAYTYIYIYIYIQFCIA